MIASERRRYILETLGSKGVIILKDTTRELGVSEITVRRDFEKLEADGKLKRVQGGATALEDPDGAELTMIGKLPQDMDKKEAVAAFAASMVEEGESVFIDGGTTMVPLAALLMKKRIRIITYNTLLLPKAAHPSAQIIIIGGEYLPYYNMNLGPLAQDMLKQFYFDRAFIGCSGIDLAQRKVYLTEPGSLSMKRIAMENAKKNYLLVDASKFSKRGFLQLCDLDRFDAVLADSFNQEGPMPENIRVPNENDKK
ncbi:MAG TPA: DeoR/GlpR family DNA-binding transcription regulator [Clostridia bacterium]|nr:DeoR/GlpR family DNA-binding transcription regulator [Clostridia bacterium]